MNVIVLVGQVIELPYLRETPSGYQCATMVLKVDRPFANSDGVYEADEIAVTLWKGIAQDDLRGVRASRCGGGQGQADDTYP